MTVKPVNIIHKADKVSRIVFHFNKKFLEDPTIPMWVLKSRGKTHYVNHVDFKEVSFSTKETPDSSHTKGSIQVRGYLVINEVDGEHHAMITSGSLFPIVVEGITNPCLEIYLGEPE